MNRIRFYSFITIAAVGIFQIGCASPGAASDESETAKPKADVAAAVKNADELFIKSDENLSNLREAVRILKQARNPAQRDFEVEWKYARFSYLLGNRTDNETERDAVFEEGAIAGRIASRMEPNKPDGYFWFGANLGEQARLSPVTVGLTKIDEIRAAMQKVIELQPGYQGASAFDALSEIEMATTLTGGSPEKAIELLEKAIQIETNNTDLHLHLATAYLAVNREPEAKTHLMKILKMKPSPGFRFEYDRSVGAAKKLLEAKF